VTRALRCGSVMGGLMLGLACGIEQPTAPSTVRTLPTLTPPPQPLPLGEPVATYVFGGALDYPIGGLTTGSQYILYDNGVFGLRYDAFAHVYLGTYRQDDDTISFRFSPGDLVNATGSLKGDLLEVRYSEMMQQSDFENAVYRRSPIASISSLPGH
jgi:hypothetical protein